MRLVEQHRGEIAHVPAPEQPGHGAARLGRPLDHGQGALQDDVHLVGRVTAIKNHDLFLRVAAHARGLARFVIYGDGRDRAALEPSAGDVLFAGGVGRWDLPGGDGDLLFDGIKKKLFPLGDNVTVLPGHGPPTKIGTERQTNPFVS